jgi:hypothetical protein
MFFFLFHVGRSGDSPDLECEFISRPILSSLSACSGNYPSRLRCPCKYKCSFYPLTTGNAASPLSLFYRTSDDPFSFTSPLTCHAPSILPLASQIYQMPVLPTAYGTIPSR